MEVRCPECGFLTWYRPGARHCAGCAASLDVTSPCPTCGIDVLPGERRCVGCGGTLGALPAWGGEGPGPALTAATTVLPADEVAALRALAANAVERMAATPPKALPPAKPHLDQEEIDAYFA